MGTTAINPALLSSLPVYGDKVPCQGPRALPVSLNFTGGPVYTLDYTIQQRIGLFSECQFVFIDASQVDNPVTVFFLGSNQAIIAKGRTQGYYPVCAPNPFKCQISCPGSAAIVNLIFGNYPMQASQWPSQ